MMANASATWMYAAVTVIGCATAGCKPKSASGVQAIATASSMKTGMFMPLASERTDYVVPAGSRIADPKQLAAILGIELKPDLTYRVSTTTDGENILFFEKVGSLPEPVYSVARDGTISQWSFFAFKTKDAKMINTHLYYKHKPGTEPEAWVSPDGTQSNMYLRHLLYNRNNILEPMLVSWINHLTTVDGRTLYRIGNHILDSYRNLPAMEFHQIGNNVWEVAGFFRDQDVTPGTIVWSENLTDFHSITPGSKRIVKWKKQDRDSMDRVGVVTAAEAKVPKFVLDALAVREKDGYGTAGNKDMPILGPSAISPDPGSIPLYQTNASIAPATRPASLMLADDGGDPYETEAQRAVRQAGALVDGDEPPAESGFALGEGDAWIRNNNNGGWLRVRQVSNEPVLYAKGAVNSWWSGSSDYQGSKTVYELVGNDGSSTGQFIEQNNIPAMGWSSARAEQRWLPAHQLRREVEATVAAKEDTVRQANARIYENMAAADSLGQTADQYTKEAEKRLKELPGKAVAAGVAAGTKDFLKAPGQNSLGAGQEAGVAMLREWGGQRINMATGARDHLDYTNIALSGAATYAGVKVGDKVLNNFESSASFSPLVAGALGRETAKQIPNKITGNFVKTEGKDIEGRVEGNGGVNTAQVQLAFMDTGIDVASSVAGKAFKDPFTKAGIAVIGEEAKVAAAEGGALVYTGREMYTRGQINQDQSTALNSLHASRQGGSVLDYLNSHQTQVDYQRYPQPDSSGGGDWSGGAGTTGGGGGATPQPDTLGSDFN